jgi:drug/metabolite transporter (DMT)-like permease
MPEKAATPPTADPRIAALLAAFCCILWGSAYPAIKLGYAYLSIATDELPAKFLFAGFRFLLAGLIVLALARSRGSSIAIRGRGLTARVLGLGLAQTGLQYAFFYIGVANTSGAKASVVNSLGSFFSAILAHFIYADDRLNPRKSLGCLLGFAGVLAVNWSGDLLFNWKLGGEAFVAIAAFVLSAASLWGRSLSRRIDPVVLTGWQLATGGLALVALGYACGGSLGPFSLNAALDLVYLALLSSVAFTIWTVLLRNNKVTSITIFNFLIPVSGVALSALILHDAIFEWRYLAALIAVCFGIALVNLGGGKKTRIKAPSSPA